MTSFMRTTLSLFLGPDSHRAKALDRHARFRVLGGLDQDHESHRRACFPCVFGAGVPDARDRLNLGSSYSRARVREIDASAVAPICSVAELPARVVATALAR